MVPAVQRLVRLVTLDENLDSTFESRKDLHNYCNADINIDDSDDCEEGVRLERSHRQISWLRSMLSAVFGTNPDKSQHW